MTFKILALSLSSLSTFPVLCYYGQQSYQTFSSFLVLVPHPSLSSYCCLHSSKPWTGSLLGNFRLPLKLLKGLGMQSVVEHLLNLYEALDLIPSTKEKIITTLRLSSHWYFACGAFCHLVPKLVTCVWHLFLKHLVSESVLISLCYMTNHYKTFQFETLRAYCVKTAHVLHTVPGGKRS